MLLLRLVGLAAFVAAVVREHNRTRLSESDAPALPRTRRLRLAKPRKRRTA